MGGDFPKRRLKDAVSLTENWRLAITATGQNKAGANNASTIYIGMAETAVTYPTPGYQPNYTIDLRMTGDLLEDIRQIGSEGEIWNLIVEIGTYADYGSAGYYPVFSWNSADINGGKLELRRGNTEDGELLVGDMGIINTYQAQEADGTYYSFMDKTYLVYTIIFKPTQLNDCKSK